MSNTVEFLRFPPLGLIDKLRLGATIFMASRRKDWQSLERIYVADWLRRWSGRRTFNKIWLPLLKAKLGECDRRTSASFIWTTLARMYAARQSGLKNELFELLDRRELKITFYIVRQDAAFDRNRAALQSIAAAGHVVESLHAKHFKNDGC